MAVYYMNRPVPLSPGKDASQSHLRSPEHSSGKGRSQNKSQSGCQGFPGLKVKHVWVTLGAQRPLLHLESRGATSLNV